MSLIPKSQRALRELENSGNIVLCHFYNFGSFSDFSGNNHYGSPQNSPYLNRNGVVFNGSNQYVSVLDADDLSFGNGSSDSAFSVCAYINAKDMTACGILGKGMRLVDGEFFLRTANDDKIYFGLLDESLDDILGRASTSTLTAYEDRWVHVAATYDGSGISSGCKIYLNGARIDSADYTVGGAYVAMENLGAPLRVGCANDFYLNGMVGHVSVFNKELIQSEIVEMYGNLGSLKWPTKKKSKAKVVLPTDSEDSSLVFSSDMSLVSDKIVDVSNNANGATKGGTNLFSVNTILGKALKFNEAEWLDLDTNIEMTAGNYTVAAWIIPEDVAAKGAIVGNYWFMYTTNNKLTHYTGSDYRDSNTSLIWGKVHFVVQTIANDGALRYYIDGELDTSAHSDADTNITALSLGNHTTGSPSYAADMHLIDIKIYSEVKDASWVKNQYAKGAKAIQFETSYGVEESVANVTSGSIGGSDIFVSSGEWKIIGEEINSKMAKVLECQSAGIAYIPINNFINEIEAAYGTWEFWFCKSAGGNQRILFVASTIGAMNAAGQDCYGVYLVSNEGIYLMEYLNGAHQSWHLMTDVSLFVPGTWYKIKITRSFAGEFTLYLNDELVTDLTSGTNPVTDTTTTTSNYIVFHFDAGDKISLGTKDGDFTFKKSLGVTQHAGLKILDNDQSTLQQTTIYMTVNATGNAIIGWGDNTFTSVTCDGSEQTLTHNYATQGAYEIKLYGTYDEITSFKCYSQSFISGDVAPFAKLTSLTHLYLYSTSVSGDISALSGLTSLAYLYLFSTSIDTYTSTSLPAWAGINLQIQNLGLDATEVDNFLIDFEDGAGAAGTLTLNGTNATRTSASDAAVASLRGAGWTVNVNE